MARVEKSLQERGDSADLDDYSSQSLPAPKKIRPIPKKKPVVVSTLEALSDHASAALHDTLLAPVPIARSASAGSLYPSDKRGILPTFRNNAPSPVFGRNPTATAPIGRVPSPMVRPQSRNSATSSPRPQDSRSRLIVETVCVMALCIPMLCK